MTIAETPDKPLTKSDLQRVVGDLRKEIRLVLWMVTLNTALYLAILVLL